MEIVEYDKQRIYTKNTITHWKHCELFAVSFIRFSEASRKSFNFYFVLTDTIRLNKMWKKYRMMHTIFKRRMFIANGLLI